MTNYNLYNLKFMLVPWARYRAIIVICTATFKIQRNTKKKFQRHVSSKQAFQWEVSSWYARLERQMETNNFHKSAKFVHWWSTQPKAKQTKAPYLCHKITSLKEHFYYRSVKISFDLNTWLWNNCINYALIINTENSLNNYY